MRLDIYKVLLFNGFEPFGNTTCDWRRKGTIEGEVERVWLSNIDNHWRVYYPSGRSGGHGSTLWELEALL